MISLISHETSPHLVYVVLDTVPLNQFCFKILLISGHFIEELTTFRKWFRRHFLGLRKESCGGCLMHTYGRIYMVIEPYSIQVLGSNF